MPKSQPQVPFPAGDLTDTVLGRIEIKLPQTPQHPATLTSAIGLKLNLIPAGTFRMGGDQSPEEIVRIIKSSSGDDVDASAFADEQPQHAVRITQPFYLGIHEVTQSQWQTVMGSNPSYFSAAGDGKDQVAGLDPSNCPVESVSWFDAVEFCNQLSQRDGLPPYYTLTGIDRSDEGSNPGGASRRGEPGGVSPRTVRLSAADRSRMGVRLPCQHDDSVPLRQLEQRHAGEHRRDLPVWDVDEGAVLAADDERGEVRGQRVRSVRHARERVRVVLRRIRRERVQIAVRDDGQSGGQ